MCLNNHKVTISYYLNSFQDGVQLSANLTIHGVWSQELVYNFLELFKC